MNIKVVLEGKLKEPFYKQGVNEYQKRLYNKVCVVETPSIKDYLKNKTNQNAYIVTLEIEGKQLSSEEFASQINAIEHDGFYNEIIFLIGGAYGLDEEVRQMSHFKFSMSKLTFLHQEAVMILIEQIYRAHCILNNIKYHK